MSLAVLELTLVDQADLELIDLPASACATTDHLASSTIFDYITSLSSQSLLYLSSLSGFSFSFISYRLPTQSGLRQSLTRTLNEITVPQW